MAAFGFAVGDFVACLMFIKEICQALDASTGSSSEVKQLVERLDSLGRAIFSCEFLCQQWDMLDIAPESKLAGTTMIDGIRSERESCTRELEAFKDSLKPYTDAFVEGHGLAIVRHAKKIAWLFRKDDAANLERSIDGHLKALNLHTSALSQLQAVSHARNTKDILSNMLEMKAQLLLISSTFQAQTTRIPGSLGYPWEANPTDHIILLDSISRTAYLPLMLVSAPKDLHNILLMMYRNIEGHRKIMRKEYTLTDEDSDGTIIEASNWSGKIRPGMQISLNMVFPAAPSLSIEHCPRCNEPSLGSPLPGQRRRCHKCQLNFRIFDKERFIDVTEDADKPTLDNKPNESDPTKSRIKSSTGLFLSGDKQSAKFRSAEESIFKRVHFYREIPISNLLHSEDTTPGEATLQSSEYKVDDLPPLHKAAATGAITEIEILLDQSFNIDLPLPYKTHITQPPYGPWEIGGCSPLHLASLHGQIKAVKCLIKRGANILARDSKDVQPLNYSIRGENPERIFYSLVTAGADINYKDKGGYTPFHVACAFGLTGLVYYLLEHGIDVNDQVSDGIAPIQLSIYGGHRTVFDILLDEGAILNRNDNDLKWSCLHFAAFVGSVSMVETLLAMEPSLMAPGNGDITALHVACNAGHAAVVGQLLDRGADIDAPNVDGQFTPLHFASTAGHESTIQLLLEKGANVNIKDVDNIMPLHWAVLEGHEAAVILLLRSGASVNSRAFKSLTPLMCAALFSHVNITRILLENNAEVNAVDEDGYTALHIAILSDSLEVTSLLLQHGTDFNAVQHNGASLLIKTSRLGNLRTARFLLDSGALVDFVDEDGETALSCSLRLDTTEMLELLLDRDAQIDIPRRDGNTTLQVAILLGNHNATKLLLERGASSVSNNGLPILHLLCIRGWADMIRTLVDEGADIHAIDIEGWSTLASASQNKNQEVIELLLEKNVSPNSQDLGGGTALHCACSKGHESIVRILIEHGAESLVDKDGRLPFHDAAYFNHSGIVRLLLQRGTNPDAKLNDNTTALMWAANKGHLETAKLLIEADASLDFQDSNGWSALHHASSGQHLEVLNLLLFNGANPYLKDNDGLTIFDHAVRMRDPNCRNLLVKFIEYLQHELEGENATINSYVREFLLLSWL